MAYKSKYLEESRKRLQGDNPNGIDIERDREYSKQHYFYDMYEGSIERENKMHDAYSNGKLMNNAYIMQTQKQQNELGKYVRDNADYMKNTFGEDEYKQIKDNSEAMLNSPYRAYYSDFRNTSDWADMTNEERENYINKNAKDTKKSKLKHMFEFFGDASAFAANAQSSLPGLENAKTNETLDTMNASLDNIKQDNEQMRSYGLYYQDLQDMKYGELLKDSSVADDVKAIADKNRFAKEELEQNQNNAYIANQTISAESRNQYIKAADEAQKRLESQGLDVSGLVHYYENKVATAQRDEFISDVKDFSNEHPVIASGLSALPTLAVKSNVEAMSIAALQSAKSTFSGKYIPADNTDKAFYPSLFQSTARGTTAQNIAESQEDDSFAQKALPFLYQTGMSMIDSTIAAVMPKGTGSALLSMNAFGQAYNDAAENNLDASNAFMTAGANAVNEFFFEKYSIDSLKGVAASVSDSVLKRTLKQMGVEASEETLTEVANTLADTVINQNQSNIAKIYDDAISKGYDEEDALKIVLKSVGGQILEAALGGAISGGLMGGAGSVYSAANQNAYYKQIGAQMSADQIKAELDYGLNSDQKRNVKIADKIQKQSVDGKTEADYSNVSAKELGKLRIKNSQSYFRNSVTEAVKNETDAKKIAKVIRDMSNGKIISKHQAEIIKDSKTAINAINESLDTSFVKDDITADTLTQISQNMAAGSTEMFNIFAENIAGKTDLNAKSSDTRSQRLNSKDKGNEYNIMNYHVPATLRDNSQVLVHAALPFAQDGSAVKINTSAGYKSMVDFNFNNPDLQSIANSVIADKNIGIAGMNTIFASYTPEIARKVSKRGGIKQYLDMTTMVYNEGLANDNIDFNTYLKKTSKIDVLAEVLTEEIAEEIYDAGRNDRIAYDTKQSKQKSGTQTKQSDRAAGEYKNETGRANELDSVYALLSKELGYDIVLVESKGDNINGYINPGSREIYITESEAKEYHTLIHEVTHYIKLNNAEDYKTIEKTVLEWYKKENGVKKFNTLRKQYLDTYNNNSAGNTYEDINEEITCDVMADMFSTEQGINSFAEWVSNKSPKEQKSIKEAFKRFFEKLRSIINKLLDSDSLNFKGYDFAEMSEIELDKMSHMWLSALDKATANAKQKNNTTENDVKYSFSDFEKIGKVDANNIKNKGNILIENEQELTKAIANSIINSGLKENYYLGVVKTSTKEKIEKDLNQELFKNGDYSFSLSSDDIRHINKHFESVEDITEAICRLYDVINNYNDVALDEYYKKTYNQIRLIFNKSYDDYDYRSVEIVSKKNRTFDLVSFFITKNNKKRNRNNSPANTQNGELASQTVSVSTNSISNNSKNVNGNSMQNNIKYSLKENDLQNEFNNLQTEIIRLRNKISELKSSDEYNRMVSDISTSYGAALDTALSNYGKWLNTSGLNDAIRILDELQKKDKVLRQKLSENHNNSDNEKKSADDLTDEDIKEYVSMAEKHFGITDNYNLAGYLTVNGKMLDFSDGQRSRVQDHREINDVLDFLDEDANYSDGLIAFMNMGNIRLNAYGIDIAQSPNEKQIPVLQRMFDKLNGEVTVDFSNRYGDSVESIDYIKGTSSEKIINDIKLFYKNGKLPNQSTVSQFHTRYSIDVNQSYYSYEALTSKPDMHITAITDGVDYKAEGITRKDIVNRAIENAKQVGYVNDNGNPVIYVEDIQTDIVITTTAIRHSLDRRINVNGPVVVDIGNILKNAIRINELNPRSDSIEKSYALIGIAENQQGESFVVNFVVNKHTNEIATIDVLYSVNAKKEPAGSSKSPKVSTLSTGSEEAAGSSKSPEITDKSATLTASKISISDLLNYVNAYFPDILPESVLKHYGYSERPDGKLGGSALYSIDVERENTQLKRKIEKLEKANEYFRQEFKLSHGRQVSQKEARRLANTIKEKWNTTLSVKALTDMFMQLADYGADGGFLGWNDFSERCNHIAKAILDSQKIEIAPERKAVLDYIRGFEFKLSASQKAECANAFGSFGEYYTANFGSIKYRNNAQMYIDEVWQEWSKKYPEYFDENISDADMPIVLSDLIKTLKDTTDNEYHFDRENAEDFLTAQIMDAYYELPMHQTFADRKQQEINRLKSKHKEALEQVKAEQEAQYNKALSRVKEDYSRKHKKLWDKYLIEINANMQIAKAERERINENEKKRKYRNQIHRDVNKLISMLVKPDKNNHVPSNMLSTVRRLVSTIKGNMDLLTGANADQKNNIMRISLLELKNDWLVPIENDTGSLSKKYSQMYDSYIEDKLQWLIDNAGNKSFNKLNVEELEVLSKILSITKKAIENDNKLFKDEKNQSIEDSASDISAYFSDKKKDKLPKAFFNNIAIGTLKPAYFFEMLGSDELTRLYKNIENGEDVYAKHIMETEQWVNDIREKHRYKKWDLNKTYVYETQAGDRLEFTLKGLMGIYANSLRKQAKEHLLGGGFKFDIKVKAKQKLKDTAFYEDNNNATYRLNEIDLVKIASMLSNEQIGYVKDVIDYLSTTVGGWGNAVTRRMYDIELYKETSYYPIVTDENFVSYSSMDYKAMRKLANSSFTKQTVTDAQNPIVLMDFEELAFKHIDQMAKYSAFTEALTDFDRVYHTFSHAGDNYQAVKSNIEAAYGKNAAAYIDKLLEDVNGNVIKTNDTGYDKWLSRFKKGAVLGSLSTVIQQPSAVVRAMSEIDPKYFTKWTLGLKNNKKAYEEIMQYAPVAFMKQMGSFDTGTSGGTVEYLIDKKTPLKKIDNFLSYGAEKADMVTWVHIWNAALNETKAMHKGENLTDEQLKIIAGKRFSDVVRKTQVYDSTFSRSQLMRNKDMFSKMITSFMAEPTTTLNMAANAIVQVRRGKMPKKKGLMVMTSLVLASALNTLLKSLVYAARDDDEDKTYFEKYLSCVPSNFFDELNPLNNIALLKDIYSICKGYDIERADMSVFSDFYKAWNQLGSDTVPVQKKIEDVVSTTAKFFGVPIGNVYRDGKAIIMTLKGEVTSDMHFSTAVTAESIKEEFADTIVFDDILENVFGLSIIKANDKNQQLYDAIVHNDNELLKRLTAGKDEDQINTAIKNALVSSDERVAEAGIAYINGDMNEVISLATDLEMSGFDYAVALGAVKSYANTIRSAKKAFDEIDTDSYSHKMKILTASGYDKQKIEDALDTVVIDEKSENSEKLLYSSDDLANAIASDDKVSVDAMIAVNKEIDIANGYDEKEADERSQDKIKSALVIGNKNVAEAGIKYAAGDISGLLTVASNLEKSGYEYNTVVKAVKSYKSAMESAKKVLGNNESDYEKKLKKLLESGVDKTKLENAIENITAEAEKNEESQLFSTDDLSFAIDSKNQQYINTIINDMKRVYIANGYSSEKADEKIEKKLTDAQFGKAKTKTVLDKMNYAETRNYINAKIQKYIKNGRSRKQACNYIGSMLESIYKDDFINGDADRRAEIITIVTNTGLYGDRTATFNYLKENWK